MIKFGPAGNSAAFYNEVGQTASTTEAAKWVAAQGLTVYEYSCGQGVNITEKTAREIAAAFEKEGVTLTLHAPYFINLCQDDPLKIQNSFRYVTESLTAALYLKAERIVIHPGSPSGKTRERARELLVENLVELENVVEAFRIKSGVELPSLHFETMGKIGQYGSLEEIIEICNLSPLFFPCIDFGHLNSRMHGAITQSPDEYNKILDVLQEGLTDEKIARFHIHFSKIVYGEGGEKCHTTFEDDPENVYGPPFEPLLTALKARKLEPYIICESKGTQAKDAATMLKYYNEL
ncbi:MAG: TIM barrel protein [Christensenellaceae bacterium]|jgi:deoxyribonuclease-4|nr:TIM barrel protein [Christensenellaceae bacterium]